MAQYFVTLDFYEMIMNSGAFTTLMITNPIYAALTLLYNDLRGKGRNQGITEFLSHYGEANKRMKRCFKPTISS